MKGDYSKAAAFNRDALHQGLKTSHMTVVYSNQCATLGAQGNYDAALEACDKALALTPTNWQAFSNRAAVNWLAGDKLQAKQDIISAKSLDGVAPEITYNMNVFG
jgi:Flp pilus assembly protein TadD